MKAVFFHKIFHKISLDFFGFVEKRFDWKDNVNFKIHDVTTQLNNCNTHVAVYFTK